MVKHFLKYLLLRFLKLLKLLHHFNGLLREQLKHCIIVYQKKVFHVITQYLK